MDKQLTGKLGTALQPFLIPLTQTLGGPFLEKAWVSKRNSGISSPHITTSMRADITNASILHAIPVATDHSCNPIVSSEITSPSPYPRISAMAPGTNKSNITLRPSERLLEVQSRPTIQAQPQLTNGHRLGAMRMTGPARLPLKNVGNCKIVSISALGVSPYSI